MEDEVKCAKLCPSWENEPTLLELKSDYTDAGSSRDIQIAKILEYREVMDGGKPISEKVKKIKKYLPVHKL